MLIANAFTKTRAQIYFDNVTDVNNVNNLSKFSPRYLYIVNC